MLHRDARGSVQGTKRVQGIGSVLGKAQASRETARCYWMQWEHSGASADAGAAVQPSKPRCAYRARR
jgi:hypothetical protein